LSVSRIRFPSCAETLCAGHPRHSVFVDKRELATYRVVSGSLSPLDGEGGTVEAAAGDADDFGRREDDDRGGREAL